MQTKWCPQCKEDLPISSFYTHKNSRDGFSSLCIEHNKLASKKSMLKRRLEMLALMGGKCVRCEFDDWRALQIDHINGGGTAEQRELGNCTRRFYNKVLANLDDYQLLCANCNTIKRFENNEISGPRNKSRKIATERYGLHIVGQPSTGRPKGVAETKPRKKRAS